MTVEAVVDSVRLGRSGLVVLDDRKLCPTSRSRRCQTVELRHVVLCLHLRWVWQRLVFLLGE
jgi:hypothetical protein